MKLRTKIACLLLLGIVPIVLPAQNYFWSNGKKVSLQKDSTMCFVILKEVNNSQSLKREIDTSKLNIRSFKKARIAGHLNFLDSNSDKTQTWSVLETKNQRDRANLNSNKIVYQTPFFKQGNGKPFGLSHLFYVKLKHEKQLDTLLTMAKKYKVEVMGNNRFMPLWYTLRCAEKTKGNALEMANTFYEKGNYAFVQADFMVKIETTNACNNMSDPNFNDQWNLKNTGQNGGTSGIDINVCDAWDITKGSSDIVVAVIDGGVQKNHPDLQNIYGNSYDGMTDVNSSKTYTAHGTLTAGIIGASHNSIGGQELPLIAQLCQ
ncbi:MAG: S8 family serine peptidase [Bacteroidetes bacterium]|nr:S8 family serine peptidase [Bacteroidota bacterium]